MRRPLISFLLLASAATSSPGLAADASMRIAETRLRHALAAQPDDAGTMVRLARQYELAGRAARASRLYRTVLTLENVGLDTSAGAVSSHAVARSALAASPMLPVRLGAR